MTHDEYWYWLCSVGNITPLIRKSLLAAFGGPEEIFSAGENELRERAGLTDPYISAVIASKDRDRILKDYEKLHNKNISFISMDNDDFPARLKQIDDCPLCLYLKGSLPAEHKQSVGMVGARACSGYGREYAEKLSGALAGRGVQIISGLAVGIDSICAKAALEAHGITFAVLGSGIDVIYPRDNIELYYAIIAGGGGIISEYPPGTPPLAWQFPHRNRLIAGLSDRLVVIEAGKRSGTLSTAMHALDQGKDVWALPGRINDRLSRGCNELIRDGAGIITDISSFLEMEGIIADTIECGKTASGNEPLTEKQLIYSLVGYEPDDIKAISEKSGLDTGKVTGILSELELDGLIVHVSGSYYARR